MACRSPIFLLSAGWRSGSTLLQRLVCSSRRIVVWGEPFGDRIPLCRLASTIGGLREDDPHLKYSMENFAGDLSKQWIANLNPGVAALHAAHLAYFERMFADAAVTHGAERWGVKWVRATGYHAWYLKWLYPEAKIVFLVRHPQSAYRSYKRKRWYTVRPEHRVTGAVGFLSHWNYLAQSFISQKDDLGALLVRYEDLAAGNDALDRLERHLETKLARDVLSERVGARKNAGGLGWWDKTVCRLLTAKACRALGYDVHEPVERDG